MKRFFVALIMIVFAFGSNLNAQTGRITNGKEILDSLTTIDPEIIKYFPRWKICEHDLQIQIYQTFLFMGYDKSILSEQNIEVLAAPREFDDLPFEILHITCGTASMNTVQIEYYMGIQLIRFLSGELIYNGPNRGDFHEDIVGRTIAKRDYCFTDIPTEVPLAASQAEVIMKFLEQPTNVNQSFVLSLFEQSVKIGNTGFWLRSQLGTDQAGYHFWSSGEAKIVLQRPLYINVDSETRKGIPYLINAYFGGGYRMASGLGNNSVFGWVPERILNAGPGGKIISGFDFHMPFEPSFGVSMNLELPLQYLESETIDKENYGYYELAEERQVEFMDDRASLAKNTRIAPIIRATGQLTAFYHLWLNKKGQPENYFRFDLGVNYNEVRESLAYEIMHEEFKTDISWISTQGIEGLKTYKPKEFGDWLFFKTEYRNQATFPFGMSVQYSNQIMLGRVWVPLFGNWLYLDARYATPLRGERPFENKNFFMISPLIRLTI